MSKYQPKVLIVEDEKPSAQALKLKLQHTGCQVQVVDNGEQALQILEQGSFDLMILDLMLPNRDGFNVLATMRGQKMTTPVVVVSNLGQPEDIKRAKELGAQEFFVKSFTPLTTIVNYIKKTVSP